MTRPVRWALGSWLVLALLVFNVTFDWQTRTAGVVFAGEQLRRHASGLPVATVNEGFRPRVGAAARRSSGWLILILSAGGLATFAASRSSRT